MRTSDNYYQEGKLLNGYDYDKQAWVLRGKYVRCGHPEEMDCKCYGKIHEGDIVNKCSICTVSPYSKKCIKENCPH